MERSVFAILFHLCLILVFTYPHNASANVEGDALTKFKSKLADPRGVMRSWDASLVNPCTWYNVTCNSDDSVTRIDLGNANLSGELVRELGQLSNLQYLELFNNNISGEIPYELGNLTNLVSLDLFLNSLTGPIPDTLGNLSRLKFLRLNNNSLSGEIPRSLTAITTLQDIDLSFNQLSGTVPQNGSFAVFTPISFNGNPNLTWPTGIQTSPVSSQAGVMSIGKEILHCTQWLIYLSVVGLLGFGLTGF